MNDIPYSWGTAVNVQMMAFGNMGDTSGTGVAFTRDPATGEKHLMGEFLMNAQGEDVVAGVRTPQKIAQLQEVMPEVYEQFAKICNTLEDHYRDMQDMEFTIEDRHLYMLQTRNGKRTAKAALKIACDLVDEGMITEEKAVADDRSAVILTPCCIRSSTQGSIKGSDAGSKSAGCFSGRCMRQDCIHRRGCKEHGTGVVRRSYWYVWRLLRRISRA